MARVGDILKIRNGYAFKSTDYQESGAPLIRQSELRSEVVDTSEAKRVDPRFLTELSGFTIREGDLLIGMSGSLGKIAEYQEKEPALQNQRTGLLLLKSGYDAKFAKLVLKFVEPQIVAEGKGIAVQNVSAKEIEDCTFALPSPDEQRRIVAEIEKQFTRLEAGVAALRRVQANLKRYRAAVLKAACEGRLVPTEAELHRQRKTKSAQLETGAELLTRILAERRKNWTGRGQYKEPIPPDSANIPPSLPEGWACASVDQMTENFDGRRVPLKSADRDKRSGQYPYYGASGIIDDIDDFLFDGDYLLIAEDGANLLSRSTPIAFKATGKFWVNNHAHIVQTRGEIPLAYLSIFLNGKDISFSVTGSAQPKLTQAALNKIPVPLPPLAEQTRIVAEVERRLSVVEELESVVTANLQRATRLRQSILQKAFTGGI
jgi:type I restriction enzyme S subunit